VDGEVRKQKRQPKEIQGTEQDPIHRLSNRAADELLLKAQEAPIQLLIQ